MEETLGETLVDLVIAFWPALLIFGAVFLALLLGKLLLRDTGLPYEKRPSLLTQAELKFLDALRQAVSDRWSICAMVRMADLIKVRPRSTQYQSWQNKILAKHIDFVLCDPETMEALLAIELDDSSHQRSDRVERDQFVDAALAAAGLPILRVPVTGQYEVRQLESSISDSIA